MSLLFVFPGQGSQSLKMMDNYLEFEQVQKTFAIAHDVLGVDFLSMLQEDDASNINQTVNTQPLLLTAGYAMFLTYLSKGGKKPDYMAGHSLGEWTALVAGGAINFEDGLRLVRLRAEAMQDSVPAGAGAMAAVLGLDDDTIIQVCSEIEQLHGGVVAGVNFNAPGQVVIAGMAQSVMLASEKLKERGARKVQLLPVSVPSHCSLMLPASEKLAKALDDITINMPSIPVIHNFNVKISNNINEIKEALIKQLYMPVLWTKSINKLIGDGVNTVVECGPGKVLSGLNKRIAADLMSYSLSNIADLQTVLDTIK